MDKQGITMQKTLKLKTEFQCEEDMNYHNILHDDMLNGNGLRVVLFVSGCKHKCKGCHNPQTHDPCSGIKFTETEEAEILDQLSKPYIKGLTLTGGDPLHNSKIYRLFECSLWHRRNCKTFCHEWI